MGNHNLELKETIEYLQRPGNIVDWWGPALVTSNTVHGNKTFGNLYRLLRLPRANQTLLCFGFIYNMQDFDGSVTVENVLDVIQSAWFTTVLQNRDSYDAIVILAHMDVQDDLVKEILAVVRTVAGADVVVQFVTGHTHKRDYVTLDSHASSIQAGFFWIPWDSCHSIQSCLKQISFIP